MSPRCSFPPLLGPLVVLVFVPRSAPQVQLIDAMERESRYECSESMMALIS